MRLSGSEMMSLMDALQSFVGQEIVIHEGISRERNGRGYDRHSATNSCFSFLADRVVGVAISGEGFGIESKDGINFYCLSLRSVIDFHWESSNLIITEHYEENTSRRTIIQRSA